MNIGDGIFGGGVPIKSKLSGSFTSDLSLDFNNVISAFLSSKIFSSFFA